jgi:hypothetical protein
VFLGVPRYIIHSESAIVVTPAKYIENKTAAMLASVEMDSRSLIAD